MKLSKVEYRNLSYHGGEHYYKSVRVGNFWSNNYIEYQSNAEKHYQFENIINDLKKYDTWKIQLMIAINFTSSKG